MFVVFGFIFFCFISVTNACSDPYSGSYPPITDGVQIEFAHTEVATLTTIVVPLTVLDTASAGIIDAVLILNSVRCVLFLLILNHYLTLNYFILQTTPFSQVMAFFVLCVWIVPFSLFISLTANDNVLPTTNLKISGQNLVEIMLKGYDPIVQSLLGSLFTWGVTAAGAALVFLFEKENKKLLDSSLGFAAGVMTAASFWSLLAPALEITCELYGRTLGCFAVVVGFSTGAYFVYKSENFVTFWGLNLKPSLKREEKVSKNGYTNELVDKNGNELMDKVSTITWRRIMLLILAITVHNIPEGLAVGVGFGAAGQSSKATFESARNLALGIGIQNFPEGFAVSLPLLALGHSKSSAFFYGQLSGLVEPLAAFLGAYLIGEVQPLLPYALAFAAGAMIFVVLDDLVPEGQKHGNGKMASWFAIFGFLIMMCLDVGLG